MVKLRRWTNSEDSIIRLHREHYTSRQISEMLDGRTAVSVSQRSVKLGLRKAADDWSRSETDKLIAMHRYASGEQLVEMLPGRTLRSVRNKLYAMGLTKRNPEWEYTNMTPSLAYLLGTYMTDGYIGHNNISGSIPFKLSVIDIEFVQACCEAYEDVCGKRYYPKMVTWQDEKLKNGFTQQWYAQFVCTDVNEWILEETQKKTKFPLRMYSADMDSKLSFVSGMFDGDGYMKMSNGRYSMGFCSADRWIFEFVSFLNGMGIVTGRIGERTLESGKPFYDVGIRCESYVRTGGYFRVNRKQKRLQAYAETILGIPPQRLHAPPLKRVMI